MGFNGTFNYFKKLNRGKLFQLVEIISYVNDYFVRSNKVERNYWQIILHEMHTVFMFFKKAHCLHKLTAAHLLKKKTFFGIGACTCLFIFSFVMRGNQSAWLMRSGFTVTESRTCHLMITRLFSGRKRGCKNTSEICCYCNDRLLYIFSNCLKSIFIQWSCSQNHVLSIVSNADMIWHISELLFEKCVFILQISACL